MYFGFHPLLTQLLSLYFGFCLSQSSRRWLTNESGDLFYCQNGCLGERICVSECPAGAECEDIWLGFKACRHNRRRNQGEDPFEALIGDGLEDNDAVDFNIDAADRLLDKRSLTISNQSFTNTEPLPALPRKRGSIDRSTTHGTTNQPTRNNETFQTFINKTNLPNLLTLFDNILSPQHRASFPLDDLDGNKNVRLFVTLQDDKGNERVPVFGRNLVQGHNLDIDQNSAEDQTTNALATTIATTETTTTPRPATTTTTPTTPRPTAVTTTTTRPFTTAIFTTTEQTTTGTPRAPSAKPEVFLSVLSEGMARQIGRGRYNLPASITLIIDGDRNILVDTGTPTDIEQGKLLIRNLNDLNITAGTVNFVIITHGHPEHFGHSSLFPNALHYFGTFLNHGQTFAFNELFNADSIPLTKNVRIFRTPGHTPEDISVVVDNVPVFGRVAVVGDLFMARQDMDFPDMWEPLAWDIKVQEINRRMVLCKVNAVVPGHGRLFLVTDNLRKKFKCDANDVKPSTNPIKKFFSV